MAVTQPTLGGSSLPWPQHDGGYQVRYEYRGGGAKMINGNLNFDLVATGSKRVITLTWVHLTEAERDTVMTRLSSLGTSSATLKTPEWASVADDIIVTLDDNMTLPTWTAVLVAGASLRYSGSVTLREV